MAKPKNTDPTVSFSSRLSPEIAKALQEHVVKTGKPKRQVIEEALRKFLKLTTR